MEQPRTVQILRDDDDCPSLPIIDGPGSARAVVWPGVGAHLRSMHRISLNPGSRTIRLQHPMEAVYYVISGQVAATDPDSGQTAEMVPGSMSLIDPGTPYVFVAGDEGAEIVGGPCPADPRMYAHLVEA
jgi:quercetin dioxygenase-like cupin family protein